VPHWIDADSQESMKIIISQYRNIIFYLGIITISFLLLFYEVLFKLVDVWETNPNYSHGYFIPFLAGFMVWFRRKEIFGVDIAPSFTWGVLVILAGMIQLFMGYLANVNFLSATSIIPVLLGISLFFWGTAVTRRLLVPVLFLIFMIPLPAIIWNQLAFPLSLMASRLSADFIHFLGMPILREGNILFLPDVTLQVEEVCSGLRSLTTMFALSALVAYLSPLNRFFKLVVFLAAVPIAIAGNIVRLIATAILARHYGPAVAEGLIHDFSGWLIFVFGLIILLLLQTLLTRLDPVKKAPVSGDSDIEK
jgi:exosortase